MTDNLMSRLQFDKFWSFLTTNFHTVLAPILKRTAVRYIQRTWRLTFNTLDGF